MEFASVALNTLLPKLAQLLQGEYKLQKGVREGIQFLYEELERSQAALREVSEVPLEQLSELVRLWARDVREVSYDMEDIVGTVMVRAQGPDDPSNESSTKEFIKKMFSIVHSVIKVKTRREVAKEIKGIKERVKEVADRRDRYKVDTITPANETTLVDPRIRAMYTKVTELVGIGEAKVEVITRLAIGDDDHNKKTVSIAGFGGLGKTTLARAVYDEIGGQFACKAFVSVSRNLDAKKLFKDMLYELDKEKFKEIHSTMLDDKHLIDEVIEFIRNKRYLVIIDDIWDIKHWEVIVLALIENNMSSRIITTTRIIDIAKEVGGCYKLKPLPFENSEKLFYGRIFGSKDKCPSMFLDVSENILKKCGGVPLAIVTTSSLLANKSENIKEWHDVCESIGSGLEKKHGMDSMRKILLLSYYDLPSHLKTCLLYLSIFPEDYEIQKDRLIWRWVAEGFVQDQQARDRSFLEIGESYFNELVNRSLIQPAGEDVEGAPEACRVHDTVLDLIISLSMEECFITIVSGDGKHSLESKQEVRRLSLHNYTTWPTVNMPKLRSLTIFEPAIFEPAVSISKPTDAVVGSMPSLSSYHLLRILDLRDYKLKNLAGMWFVGSLSHLRYLGLSTNSNIFYGSDRLPVEIGKLQFLQTLDVSETNVEEVPSSIIAGLRQLVCLRGGWAIRGTRLPDGLRNLTSLEVLESVCISVTSFECRIAKELVHLTRLRVLDVNVLLSAYYYAMRFSGNVSWKLAINAAMLESLGKLKKIESLQIRVDGHLCLDGSMEEPLGNLRRLAMNKVPVVPKWIEPASLPALSFLQICVDRERREDIQVLGTLLCLRHLKFEVMSTPEQGRCAVGPNAFPCLVSCEFKFVTSGGRGVVVPSMFPRGAMPKLQDFKFSIDWVQFRSGRCEYTGDDLVLAHLPSLRSVTVIGASGYAAVKDKVALKLAMATVSKKLEDEVAVHPNHPRFYWEGWNSYAG